jgi:hypothetical protein
MASLLNVLGKKPSRKEAPASAPVGNRVTLIVGLGTTGAKAERLIWDRFPSLRGSTIALDGEIPRDEANEFDHRIPTPDMSLDAYKARVDQVPLLAADDLIQSTQFPNESERGAGTCRTIGLLKGGFAIDPLQQKATRALRRRLAQPLDQQERLVVDLHLVAAAGGGFGSALLAITALLLRNQVRALWPHARCHIIVHLVLASNFLDQIHDPAIRAKVQANDFTTLLEINHAHDPTAVASLCSLLNCEPVAIPTFSQVIPYHVSDEAGRTATLEQVLADRVLPNILASENAGLMNRFRELASNQAAMRGVSDSVAHPIVTVCQAAVALVPRQLGPCWATQTAIQELQALLDKPATERIAAFEAPTWTKLAIEGLKNEIGQACAQGLNDALAVPGTLKKLSAPQAHRALSETYDRYHSSVRTTTAARCQVLIRHHDINGAQTIAELVNTLIDRGATVSEVALTVRALQKAVADFSDQVAKDTEKAAELAKDRRDQFQAHMRKLRTNPLMAGKVKVKATTALNEMIQADNSALGSRTLRTIARGLELALARAADDTVLVHREAAAFLGILKGQYRELRELSTAQSDTIRSVVKPAELDSALKRLDHGIRGAQEDLPPLDVKAMLASGQIGTADQIEEHVGRLAQAFEDYFEGHLTDVAGTVPALKLDFSVPEWIGETLRNLSCSAPVRMSAAGNVEPQTVIVAAGQDREVVKQVLRRNTSLARIEAVPGTDPRSIMLHRRIEGLTIEAIPTFPDARRAASQFPRPDLGLTAWQNLASTGHLLGAYEQKGLIPEEWSARPMAVSRTRRVEMGVSSDGQVVAADNRTSRDP